MDDLKFKAVYKEKVPSMAVCDSDRCEPKRRAYIAIRNKFHKLIENAIKNFELNLQSQRNRHFY